MIAAALARVVEGETLGRDEMRVLLRAVMGGGEPDVVVAAWLAALRMRGEAPEEVAGAAAALRDLAIPLPEAPAGAIDTCGTGGDGSNAFNISTISALVIAGVGVPVAKHGNRAASSLCGSADVLEALGVDLDVPPARMAASVHEIGIGFLYARACHPAMARVAPIRSALGIRTLFNRAAPLANPMHVRRQLVGVAGAAFGEPTARVLLELGCERAWVVFGRDGIDKLSLADTTDVWKLEDGRIRHETVEAGSLVPRAEADALIGGDPAHNADIARGVLAGEKGPRRDAVVLNAAAGLCVAGRAESLGEGVEQAAGALDSGAAAATLERWIAFLAAGTGDA